MDQYPSVIITHYGLTEVTLCGGKKKVMFTVIITQIFFLKQGKKETTEKCFFGGQVLAMILKGETEKSSKKIYVGWVSPMIVGDLR